MDEGNIEEGSSSRTFGEREKVARRRWSLCWVLKEFQEFFMWTRMVGQTAVQLWKQEHEDYTWFIWPNLGITWGADGAYG